TVVEAALDAGCVRALIAGEIRSPSATNVNEEPRFGGPTAGLAAALPMIEEEWIMLLACDLPQARELCGLIVDAARNGGSAGDGILVTASGRKQWLAGWYRRSPIMARMDRIGNPAGSPVRDLLGG